MGQVCSLLPTLCMATVCEKCCTCCISNEMPWSQDQLTPAFFTAILREKGAIAAGTTVASVDLKVFGTGVGLLSTMLRATLTYSDTAAEGKTVDPLGVVGHNPPLSLIVKMAPEELQARLLGEYLDLFTAEINFFERDLPGKAGLATPICYYAGASGYGRYLLILEDLAPAESGDQMKGASFEDAHRNLLQLSLLHSKYRGVTRTSPDTRDWLLKADDMGYYKLVGDKFNTNMKHLDKNLRNLNCPLEFMTPYLREAMTLACHHIVHTYPATKAQLAAVATNPLAKDTFLHLTVTHGDARLENFFFTAGPTKDQFRMIDFQLTKEYVAEADIMYFISMSMDTDVRRKHEKELLRAYFSSVIKNGGKCSAVYSMQRLLNAYLWSFTSTATILGIGIGESANNSERAQKFWTMCIRRLAAWADDWQIVNHYRKRARDAFDATTGRNRLLTRDELREILPKTYHDLLDEPVVPTPPLAPEQKASA